ncbi:MAG: sigma 54-interacting transcriptional regulator [Candidatus Cloacimonetes bacterium]|nr:sigma 54-interacting transcriptional regulator [Candidatus Cloacimonadota bacterium]
MDKKINDVLMRYVVKPDIIDSVIEHIEEPGSCIVEVIGPTGTGKSYLCERLQQTMAERKIEYREYAPRIFSFNQVRNLVCLLTGIDDDQYSTLVNSSEQFKLTNRYDFFYFLSEKLSEQEHFDSQIVLLDNCNVLDEFTLLFMEYLVQYATDKRIVFLTFTTEPTFLFSKKVKLEYLDTDEIHQVLTSLFDSDKTELITQSEVLLNITGGNLFIIERLLNRFYGKSSRKGNKGRNFDLSNYLDDKLSVERIYRDFTEGLTQRRHQLAVLVFLIDGRASREQIEEMFDGKPLGKDLDILIDEGLVMIRNDRLVIGKTAVFRNYFLERPADEQRKTVREFLKKAAEPLGITPFGQSYYQFIVNDLHLKLITPTVQYLMLLNDHETLRTLDNVLLEKTDKPDQQVKLLMELGITNKCLNNIEASAENFRQALRLCTTHQFPAEEVVFQLAESLFSINSSAFALEVIKKYEPNAKDDYWRCRLLMLQADIITDLEHFDDAFTYLESAMEVSVKIKDEMVRGQIQGLCKKIKGKVYYFSNQFENAEAVFREAEQLFRRANDSEGLAAIYNNLGVLAMFQGEWDKTEELYTRSLKLEQQRFNLNGISVCYNNLGGLLEDRGDYKKSLNYLYEALHIQKLLSDRYNITNIYNNIGVTYMDNAEYEEADKAFKQSLQTAINFNLYRSIIAALNNLGALYFKSGKWTRAIEHYERAIERSKENNFLEGLCTSYNNLGELFEKRGEYNLAYDLYFKGLEILPDVQDEILKAELYGNLGSVLTHLHNFGKAYAYLVESYDFFKSINAKDKLMIEACQKQAYYFIQTRNYESASYYLDQAIKMAEELNSKFEVGNAYFLKALLEKNDREKCQKSLERAIEIFVETKNNFELAQANYEYAHILFDKQEWEQALQILQNNKKIIKDFDAIKFLEKNDILIQKIMKEHAIELKESRSQESLLTKFYEITQSLNTISDFDVLIDTALDNLVELSEADGGIICLYNSRSVPEGWEYQVFNHFTSEEADYDILMEYIQDAFIKGEGLNIKQPHSAPQFNNIICFPLMIRGNNLGVILLFSKHGSHYFTEKMYNLMSALCNQIVVILENIRHSNLTRSHAIIREELNASQSFTNIIGKSERIQEIFNVIEKIKNTPTTVLLEGPSGTGKELIARAIHYTSNRRNKKFVAQYCGALPETLLESELFGHVKGSFTGAVYDKKGLFEIADGGTFFLDEIADITLSTQAKLLRFLQEGELKRVGSTKTTKVDVRVICATNVSLQERVNNGEFRLDLYYRLNVIKISIPSLKERKSDVPLLAIHFLDKYNKKMSKNVLGITDEAMKYMSNCDWPGNIRQLENEIERAVTLAENESFIKPGDLSEEVFKYADNAETIDLLDKVALKEAVESLEKKMILKSLESRGWNQTQAAKDLGLSRQGLIKKMKRYEVER